jgi:BMFP domain-containing protein YqiC
MPAVSKAQQRFMGMVHATQKGDMETPSKDVKTVAKSISKQDAKDFASTPHKGLPDNIKEMILSELRSIGIIQKEYFSVIDDIKKTLSAYKDNKGTDKEKQIVSKLKLLNDKKKKLSDEMDGKVSSMYKDAELKVDEASTTASADGYATPYAFSKPNQTKNKNNKLARVSGGTLVDELDESVNEDQSWKRLLDPYNWFKSKDIFQNRFKNTPSSVVQELIKLTKKNGDDVKVVGNNVWGFSDKSGKDNQALWQYSNGHLYYTNPHHKSTYDTIIPKLVNSKNESVNENLNESAGISSMGDVKLGQWITLKNGTRGKIIAISDKSNPKYKKGIVIITPEFGKGNVEISIYTDLKNESVNETLNESEITSLLIKGLVGILAAGGAAVVKVVARTLVDRVIDGAILTYHDIKNIVAPEPYIKFLKELQKNDKFNKEFIGIILSDKTGEASSKLFRILSGDMPPLQSFVEAFDKFTSQQNISGDDKKSLLRKIQNSMAQSYMSGWRDVHKNLKKKYPDITKDLLEGKLNENRWIDIKNEDSPATTKVNKGISNINKQLAEIEKFLGWYGKLKSENGLGNEDLWKRTNSHIYSIKERLLNLERKLRKISE